MFEADPGTGPSGEPEASGSGRESSRRESATRRLLVAGGVVVVVVAVDQVTKSMAEKYLTHPVHLIGPLGLGLTYNSGSAFSLFTGNPAALSVVVVAMIVVLFWLVSKAPRASIAVSLGLILGGAIGNLSDRIFRSHHGAVVDFITFTHWPTFNVADSSITVGVVLLLVLQWVHSRHSDGVGKSREDSQR